MSEYERIKEYICNEPRMEHFLEQAQNECMESNCQSWVVILTLAIEKLLDAYEDKCDAITLINEQLIKYMRRTIG